MKPLLFIFLFAALITSHALHAVEAVTKHGADDTLTESLATGAHSLTVSASGTLVLQSGFTLTGASYLRTAAGLVIGTDVQAYDADLTTYAGITPSADVQSLLAAANYAAMRSALGLVINTNVQAYDGDLITWGSMSPSSNVQTFINAGTFSGMRSALGVAIGVNVQPYDANTTVLGSSIGLASEVDGTLPAANGGTGLTALGTGVATWLATPSEANLKAVTSGIQWLDTAGNITAASAASTPARYISGAWYSGGSGTTTTPHVLIQPSAATAASNWNTDGTGLAINGHSGTLLDIKTDGVGAGPYTPSSNFRVDADGGVYFGSYKMTGGAYGACMAVGNLYYGTGAGINYMDASGFGWNYDVFFYNCHYGMPPVTGVIWMTGVSSSQELRIAANGLSNDNLYVGIKFDGTNGILTSTGNLVMASPMAVPSGTNQRAGNATLVAGTATVSNATVASNTLVILTRKTAGGTLGNLTYTLTAGSSFTINSDSVTDTSVITYLLIENP